MDGGESGKRGKQGEQRSDAARAIDSYERLMDRFLDSQQSTLRDISSDAHLIVGQLETINGKLSDLSMKMAKIEQSICQHHTECSTKDKPKAKSADVLQGSISPSR